MPTLVEWILLIAATAYLTWIVNNTAGPYGLFSLLREIGNMGDNTLSGWQKILYPVKATLVTFGEMAQCAWCASFWVGLIAFGLFLYIEPLLWVFAACGFVNALRTIYQHVALPRENKIRIDTAKYLKETYGTTYAVKYLELGDVQKTFEVVNKEHI